MRKPLVAALALVLASGTGLSACASPEFKGSNAAYCVKVKKALDKLDDLGDPTQSRKTQDVVKKFQGASDAMAIAVKDPKAPEAIKADVATLDAAIREASAKVTAAGGNVANINAKALTNDAIDKAATAVIAFLNDPNGCQGKVDTSTPTTEPG